MNNFNKNILRWVLLLVVLVLAYDLFDSGINNSKMAQYDFSDFLNKVEDGRVANVTVQGRNIEGTLEDGISFSTYATDYPGLVEKLRQNNVKIKVMPLDSKMNSLLSIFVSWFPVLLLVGVWIFFMRQMQGGNGKAMGFGKSKAKMLTEKLGKITFADVAGIEEAKHDLVEIVDFLKDPAKFQALGGKIPKGCLLIGPPGTGKTLLARAIAGEANVPFFTISGSDFVEMFVGVGASRVRDMFEQGKKNAPCIIFIDEIDAVGRHRGIGLGGGNDEREQTLNQLLVEMDGFEDNEGVIIVAATNRPDVLDPALLRPGRFDRQIMVPIPDMNGREKILAVHLKKIALSPDVKPMVIARGTPGFSGADLANLANEAALLAARHNKKMVTMADLEYAKDKIMMGAERKSMLVSDKEKKLTAYHEAGHAIVTINCPAADPIHKATIIPRGNSLGMVMRLPESDKVSQTRDWLESYIALALGGRVAEELIFGYGNVTSGASSDIKQASSVARAMVCEYGMSDKVGPIFYGNDNQDMYNQGSNQKAKSEDMMNLIESEVRRVVEDGRKRAEKILTEHIDQLHIIANALLEYETLTGQDIADLVAGKTLSKKDDDHEDTQNIQPVVKSSFPKHPPIPKFGTVDGV